MSLKRTKLKEQLRKLDPSFNSMKTYFNRMDKLPSLLAQLHIEDIQKYRTDSFKAYKSAWYIKRDVLDPVYGIANILSGILKIALSPVAFLFACAIYALQFEEERNTMSKALKESHKETTGLLFDSLAQTLHGCVQVAAAPLTWLVRIPVRAIITSAQGWKSFPSNDSLKVVLDGLDHVSNPGSEPSDATNLGSTLYLLTRLEEKIAKANTRGQSGANLQCRPDFQEQNEALHQSLTKQVRSAPKSLGGFYLSQRYTTDALDRIKTWHALYEFYQYSCDKTSNESKQPVSKENAKKINQLVQYIK